MYVCTRTCPDDDGITLGAVAGPPLSGYGEHIHLPAGQLGEVAAAVVGVAAGELTAGALQCGRVAQRAHALRPLRAHRAVLTAHPRLHRLRGAWS